MAVFTPVSRPDAERFIADYALGPLTAMEPISEGVENTNYAVVVGDQRCVLTLFEKRARVEDLPGQLGLLAHWALDGLPAPRPKALSDGTVLRRLNDRPAALVSWVEGAWPRRPTAQQAKAAGAMLARLHDSAGAFPAAPPQRFGPAYWRAMADRCAAARPRGAHAQMARALERELDHLEAHWPSDLPATTIHGDYFPDNVLFTGPIITGVIDAYFAGWDARAYDLAIALNAWGFDQEGRHDPDLSRAFAAGYEAHAPLTTGERAALPLLCRGAAVRFTLSRLHDVLHHDESWLVTPKDPAAFFARLEHYQAARSALDCGF